MQLTLTTAAKTSKILEKFTKHNQKIQPNVISLAQR